MSGGGWIGVDLDGTLARYDGWKGIEHIGPPVEAMAARVQRWHLEGQEVRIMTARVCEPHPKTRARVIEVIEKWCQEHLGFAPPITNVKDFGMIELWDDRCVTVEANTGKVICSPRASWTP